MADIIYINAKTITKGCFSVEKDREEIRAISYNIMYWISPNLNLFAGIIFNVNTCHPFRRQVMATSFQIQACIGSTKNHFRYQCAQSLAHAAFSMRGIQ